METISSQQSADYIQKFISQTEEFLHETDAL